MLLEHHKKCLLLEQLTGVQHRLEAGCHLSLVPSAEVPRTDRLHTTGVSMFLRTDYIVWGTRRQARTQFMA